MTLLLSDRKLLDAFRRGETWAIERIYHAYVVQVARVLEKGFSFMSGGAPQRFAGYDSAWELEVAVQDTFVLAFSEAARRAYDGISPYAPYLLTIARNRVISQLRSDAREQRRRSALASEPLPEAAASPEKQLLRREAQHLVAEFRGTLPPDLRRFLDVRYGEERNLLEAARLLGLSRMRARLRDRKVRQLFIAFLGRRGYLQHGPSGRALLLLVAP